MNINQWVFELREIARRANLKTEEGNPLTDQTIKELFCKNTFSEAWERGDTPQEAFDNEMEEWRYSF